MRTRSASLSPIWDSGFTPPERLLGDGWTLLPLHPRLAQSDLTAFRSCQVRLREELDWNGWPPEDFTLGDNIQDLTEHYSEFVKREAYAYSIQTPDACIGCIYIEPWHTGAQLAFWFIDAWLDRESQILTAVLGWLDEWPLEQVILPINADNSRVQTVLRGMGLQTCDGPPGHVSFFRPEP